MSPAQHHLHIDAKENATWTWPTRSPTHGRWSARGLGSGKWLLRELRAADPVLAGQLLAAHDRSAELTELADLVLA